MKQADQHEPFEGSPATSLSPYRARNFTFEGCLASGPMTVKLYSICRGGDTIPAEWLDQVRAYVAQHTYAAAEEEGDHHELGFAVVHAGEQATWLLMHWWAHADICCQQMVSARVEGSTDLGGFSTVENPFHACVWEGVVINHEHQAWVRAMLTQQPDPERYLRDVLPDGLH